MSNDVLTRVWKQSPQKGSALLLTVAIADIVNNKGVGFPGDDYLKDRIRMSRRNTERLIGHLEDTGEIYRRVGQGRGNKTFYAVLSGLDKPAIEHVLGEHVQYFDLDPSGVSFVADQVLEKRRQFVQQKGVKMSRLSQSKTQSSKSIEKATKTDLKGDIVERKTPTTHEPLLKYNTNTNTFPPRLTTGSDRPISESNDHGSAILAEGEAAPTPHSKPDQTNDKSQPEGKDQQTIQDPPPVAVGSPRCFVANCKGEATYVAHGHSFCHMHARIVASLPPDYDPETYTPSPDSDLDPHAALDLAADIVEGQRTPPAVPIRGIEAVRRSASMMTPDEVRAIPLTEARTKPESSNRVVPASDDVNDRTKSLPDVMIAPNVLVSMDEFQRRIPAGHIARYDVDDDFDGNGNLELGNRRFERSRIIHYHKGTLACRSNDSLCGYGGSNKSRKDRVFHDYPTSGPEYHVCPDCAAEAERRIAAAGKAKPTKTSEVKPDDPKITTEEKNAMAMLCYGTLNVFNILSKAKLVSKTCKEIKLLTPGMNERSIKAFERYWKTQDFRGKTGRYPEPRWIPDLWMSFVEWCKGQTDCNLNEKDNQNGQTTTDNQGRTSSELGLHNQALGGTGGQDRAHSEDYSSFTNYDPERAKNALFPNRNKPAL